jgi:hypothetical protein
MMTDTIHVFQSFWHGPPPSPYERLAMKSFLDHGHQFTLFTYDETLDVPAGVRIEDAGSVIPHDDAFVLKGYDNQGGFVAFSNLFRYELMARFGGWWVDLDVICLTAKIPTFETFFALERAASSCEVGTSVLHFSPGDPLMVACAAECRRRGEQLRASGASRSNFGSLGPQLLRQTAERLGRCSEAQQPATCCPLPWTEAEKFSSPSHAAEVKERASKSLMVHLFNEARTWALLSKDRAPPKSSFLGELFDRHGVRFPPRPLWKRARDYWRDIRK